jgi:hypothetical protein
LWASRALSWAFGLKWCPENIRKRAKATSVVSGGNKNERNSRSTQETVIHQSSGSSLSSSSLPVVLAMH